ncbi:MAG: hypothetical protein ABJ308_01205 [Halieaceae bacterium]
MSMYPRPENSTLQAGRQKNGGKWASFWRTARWTLVALPLVLGGLTTQVQAANPQRAIERLEGCTAEERKQGCIRILARQAAGDNKQAIKAQVRGGRIIWYEYNSKTGKVRRTN